MSSAEIKGLMLEQIEDLFKKPNASIPTWTLSEQADIMTMFFVSAGGCENTLECRLLALLLNCNKT